MAVYKLFPEKDAAIYSLFPEMNTGLDEILDVSNLNQATNTSAQVARYLVQFNQSEIANTFSSLIGTASWDADFKCFIATAEGINLDYTLKVHAVSGSWGMGTGKYLDNPINTDGTSWKWKTYAGGVAWLTSSFAVGSTGSFSGSAGGGNWYIAPTASQTFDYRSDKDLNVRVTNIVTDWSSSSKQNNGFLVKWDSNIEFSQARATQPLLQYYSVDTHTIYPPVLELKWNDYIWNTGSSTQTVLNTPQLYASIANNQGFFYSQSIQQFREAPDTVRKAVMNEMDVKFRDVGGLNIGEARLAVADPKQLNAPTLDVMNIGEIFADAPMIMQSGHPAYPRGVPGQGLGIIDQPRTVFELLPQVVKERGIADPKNFSQADRRAMEMKPYGGIINEELLKALGY
jgi:hypothetical protein